ncbi:Enhancer of polycomb-like transcription factor protein [Prunus dulcis]|uniref:Enhancer of polycomb-like protein n=1 Tax=Prunus dulcis TaxID=3755 RepID=A0A4Y1QYM3_PRUDU|nr:Enhancer of polycomb-like transcription factor protein [Prunus dulcis]
MPSGFRDGMVKGGVDGARVLRSGRRLWPESSESKLERARNGDEDWLKLMKSHAGESVVGLNHKKWAGANQVGSPRRNTPVLKTSVVKKPQSNELLADLLKEHKRYGIVYTRKRKRASASFLGNVERESGSDDRMYGRRFARRQRMKKSKELDSHPGFVCPEVLCFSVESSCAQGYWAGRFLYSVLVYMTRASLGLTEFSEFLALEPIGSIFASYGIQFSRDRSCTRRSGVCKLFGAEQFIPLFSVDFSAVPGCFMFMHTSMHLRFRCHLTVNNLIDGHENGEFIDQGDDDDDDGGDGEKVDFIENRHALHSSVRVPKLACRSTQYRNGLTSRGIQKRRSSLRRRRSRNPSLVSLRKPNGALVSELISIRKNGLPFSSVESKHMLRKSVSFSPAGNLKAESLTIEGSKRDLDSTCCSANILFTELDKCYREDGATVMLEMSSSGEWLLVVKKNGLTRYTHKAEKVMRPCSKNRITQAIIWSADSNGDNNWKLEFPNRCDWAIFKDLYKECSDRVVPAPAIKFIPVPGVREVPGYADSHSTPFDRPESYIYLNDDEVSRAMAKRTANYDMDSDDEEWLKKFNSDFFAENELHDHVSEDNFELMGHQSKRALLDPKPVLRKRRSFKRQPSQFGRGKQPSFLQAMAAEQDALQEQNAIHKVEEAKAEADRSVELAIRKRKRAQLLMQNADLVTYKATMAFRIAEAAQVLGSPDAAAAYVLD